jgi:hypothetical protein
VEIDPANPRGEYAWWVGDEGVKVKANVLQTRERAAELNDWEERLDLQTPPSPDLKALDGFTLDAGGNTDSLAKVMSEQQLQWADTGSGLTSTATLQNHFHDITTHSLGVLSDTALGGLKRDLTIPFELPDEQPGAGSDFNHVLNLPTGPDQKDSFFTNMWEFHNSGDQDSQWKSIYWPSNYVPIWWAKKQGYVFQMSKIGTATDRTGLRQNLRGPTWQMLRTHYRSYKREYEKLSRNDPSRRGMESPGDDRTWLARPYLPYSHRHNSVGNHDLSVTYVADTTSADRYRATSPWEPFYIFGNSSVRPWSNLAHHTLGLRPVLTRLGLAMSYFTDDLRGDGTYRLNIVADFVGTLWNPYNVPIQLEGYFAHLDMAGIAWTMTHSRAGVQTEYAWDIPSRTFGPNKQFPFQFLRMGVTNETSPTYFSSNARPRDLMTLMPGEVRTFTINQNSPQPYSYTTRFTSPGAFVNNFNGGVSLYSSDTWRVQPGDQVRFILDPRAGGNISLRTFMGYFQRTNGTVNNPFAANATGENFFDLPELSSLHIKDASRLPRLDTLLNEFPVDLANKKAFAYLEFRRKAADEIPDGIAMDIDPRSIVDHARASDENAIPSNWEVDLRPVSDFDLLQGGIGPRNNGFWGTSHSGAGETHITMFEVPDAPLTSLGALQHVQTAAAPYDMPYAIGSSTKPPQLGANQVVTNYSSSGGYTGAFYDMPFLVNSGLWDSYYFSGNVLGEDPVSNPLNRLESQVEDFLDAEARFPFANPRMTLASTSRAIAEDELKAEMTHYRYLARHLMLDGAFNVNSTRVAAWKAWLMSLRNRPLPEVSVSNGAVSETSSGSRAAFTRNTVVGGGPNEEWRGYSELSEAEIDRLAEEIVSEVKRRGPFLSMADFVNRRLANGDTGEAGALQAAIENAGLNINNRQENGIPGSLRQGDILANLGSSLSARSDTFRVRAYGEFDGAKVWCEAIVQRVPLLVDDNGELLTAPNPAYPGNNPAGTDMWIPNSAAPDMAAVFGRQFVVQSFRWLSPDEI